MRAVNHDIGGKYADGSTIVLFRGEGGESLKVG